MRSQGRLIGPVLTVMLAAGCAAATSSAAATKVPTPSSAQPTPPCLDIGMTADWGPYVIAGVTEEGTLPWYPLQSGAPDGAVDATIVVGVVTGFEAGVADPPGSNDREWRVFTPVEVRVEHVIRGEVEPGTIRIFIEGGTAGCLSETVDTAPRVDIATRYLMFLYPSRTSDGARHPDRLELTRDAWPVDGQNVVSTPAGPMPLADLISSIGRITASPLP
jgi:hypothetical protein